jgi:hypothetical protein
MPTQIEKWEAHASHLLDEFIRLRERYAMLDPMLFNQGVVASYGAGHRARGFLTLRQSLFLTCVQDIAKHCLDKDERTPSIRNIAGALEDRALTSLLRERYAIWRLPVHGEDDPAILEALRRMEAREEAERRQQFDEHLKELRNAWLALEASPDLASFCTIRDKLTAHTEIRFVADKYQLVDLKTLGIKWGALKALLTQMQHLVELIGIIVRNAGFAWDMLDEQLTEAATRFWDVRSAS